MHKNPFLCMKFRYYRGALHQPSYVTHLSPRHLNACKLMDIHFADHVIVTDGHYYNYHEQGKC